MKQILAQVVKQDKLLDDIFSLVIKAPELAAEAHSGQFVSLYSGELARLLPRPISICEVDKEEGTLRLVYRTVGEGTKEFSKLEAGDSIRVTGPTGNGYEKGAGKAILFGGGIGIPPMLQLAKELYAEGTPKEDIIAVLGFNDSTFLVDDFEKVATVYISSMDGSVGTKGTVIDAANENGLTGDMIYSCGPMPMLRAVKSFAEEKGIRAQLSLEERMACGIGACLACVCKTTEKDEHSQVNNKRVCVDGPVFWAEEVDLT